MDIMSIISVILGVLFGLLALFGVTIRLRKKIYWCTIKKGFKKLEQEIRRMKPEVVVGLADGRIIGAIIVSNLRIEHFYAIDIPVECDESGDRTTKILGKEHVGDLSGKKVLLVDNHVYTGVNMAAAFNFLKSKNPAEIKTLVLFKHQIVKREIDYFAFEIKGKRKVMPWSYTKEHETACNI